MLVDEIIVDKIFDRSRLHSVMSNFNSFQHVVVAIHNEVCINVNQGWEQDRCKQKSQS
jgi:hypothetical protein